MDFDVVMPHKNELELISMAEKLGFKELILFYEDSSSIVAAKTVESKKVKLKVAVLAKDVNELGKLSGRQELVLCPAERAFFESKKASYIICSPVDVGRDYFYQRRSDLDDATCELARKNNILLIFDVGAAHDPMVLGRLSQNAKLARKYKVDFNLATFARHPLEMRAPKDLDALKRLL